MTRLTFALALLLFATLASAIPRDRNELNAFKRAHPCPRTGSAYGACHGWQVDHIVPLKCAGIDKPANMQWLTVRAHKAKTKREARLCMKPRVKRLSAPLSAYR